jgi:hypothetical protein
MLRQVRLGEIKIIHIGLVRSCLEMSGEARLVFVRCGRVTLCMFTLGQFWLSGLVRIYKVIPGWYRLGQVKAGCVRL